MSDQPSHSTKKSRRGNGGVRPATVTGRVALDLTRRIEHGELAPGDRLPSSRALARSYGASINTVQAAIGRLEAGGLITCAPRRRSVVNALPQTRRKSTVPTGLVVLLGEPGADYSDYSRSWGAQILYAAEAALAQNNIAVAKLYVPTVNYEVPAEELAKIKALLQAAGGVIWLASGKLQPLIAETIDRGVPCVTLNAPEELVGHNLVKANNIAAGRVIGRVFARLDYQRCLLLTRGIRYRRFAPELAQGFIDSFMKAGIPLRGIDYHDCERNEEALAEAYVSEQLRHGPPPQGIFAVSDALAIGAMRACQAAGLRVPEDVGVVSATGFETCCNQSRPTLSAWRQPTAKMGEEAAKMLKHLMQHPGDRLPPRLLGSALMLRQSLPRHEQLIDEPDVEFPEADAAEPPLAQNERQLRIR